MNTYRFDIVDALDSLLLRMRDAAYYQTPDGTWPVTQDTFIALTEELGCIHDTVKALRTLDSLYQPGWQAAVRDVRNAAAKVHAHHSMNPTRIGHALAQLDVAVNRLNSFAPVPDEPWTT